MTTISEVARDRSRSPSRPPSRPQTVERSQQHPVHANSLEPPSRQQSTQSQWDASDPAASAHNSPGFSYTPSYQDSYTPYGSPSNVWNGSDSAPIHPGDELGESAQVDYDPADFDSHSGLHSPFLMLDGDVIQGPTASRIPADFLSGNTVSGFSNGIDANNNSGYSLTDEPGSEFNQTGNNNVFGLHPHRQDSGQFGGRFSPRPDAAPSPASSVGLAEPDFSRSRASSVSSLRHSSPAAIGHIGEAFDRLGFDQVDSDLMWRNQQQQQQAGATSKPNSPPQLLIPSEAPNPNSLQIPSFGQPHINGGPAPDSGMGGLAAPSINLLPATPVSGGGAGGTHVPFQQVLRNLTEQRQQALASGDATSIANGPPQQVPNSFSSTDPSSSRPSTPGQPTASVDFSFPSSNDFSFPGTPSAPPSNLGQGLTEFFGHPSQPRTRSYSDASRQTMTTFDHSPMIPGMGAPHPSLGSYSPNLAPPHLSSIGRNNASTRSSPFGGSTDSLPLNYSPVPPPSDLGMGMPSSSPFDAGLMVSQQRHRLSRSEDYSRGMYNAAPPPPTGHMLGPDGNYMTSYSYGPPQMHYDMGIPSSIGPQRSGRRGSSSSHHDRVGSTSARVSPYPSPSGSPALLPHSLPNSMHGGEQGGNNPWSKVERQQVTTPATAKASEGRRKGEATFVCPVPGCLSTFTRHFNLKGHLRSHNEERPFKCKWPGCEKGFARQHDCKRHEALHLNLRPYTCEGCKKTFARMDALNRHLKSEGGVDCARAQGTDPTAALYGLNLAQVKDEHQGWAPKALRNSAVAM